LDAGPGDYRCDKEFGGSAELEQPRDGVGGKDASFIVLNTNPLVDIKNTAQIADVYLKGHKVDQRDDQEDLLVEDYYPAGESDDSSNRLRDDGDRSLSESVRRRL